MEIGLDARIKTAYQPCFGCHSDLDKYRKTAPPPCHVPHKEDERACDGCERRTPAALTS